MRLSAAAMLAQPAAPAAGARRVPAGQDRFGEQRVIGASLASFKVAAGDSRGGLFILEHKHTRKGGPALHLHRNEDEWFYVLEGRYVAEAAGERTILGPGDSLLIPRRTPHAFAFTGDGTGRMLVAFSPAGRMEASFRAFQDRHGAYSRWDSPEEQRRARSFGMELLGPPLTI